MKKALVNKVNRYIANIGVSYVKLHNLHWNVVGPQFKAVHEYLESLYDSYADVLDEVAEHLKMEGRYPAASLREYLELADVQELESGDIRVEEALRVVYDDMELLKNQAADIREAADKAGDFSLVSMMEDQIGEYSKQLWFVGSMLK